MKKFYCLLSLLSALILLSACGGGGSAPANTAASSGGIAVSPAKTCSTNGKTYTAIESELSDANAGITDLTATLNLESKLGLGYVVYGNGVYLNSSISRLSNDGTNWIQRLQLRASGTPIKAEQLSFMNDQFWAIANGKLIASKNGKQWRQLDLPLNIRKIVFKASRYIAYAEATNGTSKSFYIITSSDGINWTTRCDLELDESELPFTLAWDTGTSHLSIQGNRIFTTGLPIKGGDFSSDDGITWVQSVILGSDSRIKNLNASLVVGSDTGYVAVENYTNVRTTTGQTNLNVNCVFIFTQNCHLAFYSRDGRQWSPISLDLTGYVYDGQFQNSQFLLLGYDQLRLSKDGILWNKSALQTINPRIFSIASFKGIWLAVSYDGIFRSQDGVDWKRIPETTASTQISVANNQLFLYEQKFDFL
ncbi:hypothetical protein [Undibacterium sp. Di24W]|uniref:hypothetical protein n=1 Tax=Undibacterium sp. Di24W TaxID=3413033 RepID=UPI003BF1081C